MFHGLWLIMALILAVSLSLYLVVMAVLVTAYLLFCGPYLWWACAHLPKDRRPFSMGRDFHNAWRFYRSRQASPRSFYDWGFFIPGTGFPVPG